MDLSIKIWFTALMMSLATNLQPLVHAEPQVPCYFIFGDSFVDDGNNNLLPTVLKSNYSPYGIDFPDGPTGRFCNGRTTADVITQLLGFEKFIPPFTTARGNEIIMGVNYASGGSGIRDETGYMLGARFTMNAQLLNHRTIISRITALKGSPQAATDYLRKCIYTVGMGSNDYVNNYFLPQFYLTSRLYTPQQYATVLIQQYSGQLRTLYNYGARKIALFGLRPLGCSPREVASQGNGSGCVDSINRDVQLFNTQLRSLVDILNNNLSDAKFIYINSTNTLSAEDAIAAGITNLTSPCCNVNVLSLTALCVPNQAPCSNRSQYLFWDGFHPTEAANVLSGTRAYSARSPLDAYPMDIRQLAQR